MSIWQYSRSQRKPSRAIRAIGGAIYICHTYVPKKNLSEEQNRAIGAQEEPYREQGMPKNSLSKVEKSVYFRIHYWRWKNIYMYNIHYWRQKTCI